MTEPKIGSSSSISAVRDSMNQPLHYTSNPNPMMSSNGSLNHSLPSLQPVSPLVVNKPAATLPELSDLKPSVSPGFRPLDISNTHGSVDKQPVLDKNIHNSRRKPIRRVPVTPNPNTFSFVPTPHSQPLARASESQLAYGHDLLDDKKSRRISMALFETDEADNTSNPYLRMSSSSPMEHNNSRRQHVSSMLLDEADINSIKPPNLSDLSVSEKKIDVEGTHKQNDVISNKSVGDIDIETNHVATTGQTFNDLLPVPATNDSASKLLNGSTESANPEHIKDSIRVVQNDAQKPSETIQPTNPFAPATSSPSSQSSSLPSYSSSSTSPNPFVSSAASDSRKNIVRGNVDEDPQPRLAASLSSGFVEDPFSEYQQNQISLEKQTEKPSKLDQDEKPFKPEQSQSSPKQTLDQVPSKQQQAQQPSMPEHTQPQRQERKSSLHRHAVSNASFDFGFPGQAGQNVNALTPFANTVTPPVSQPPIIQPQPIRQPFNFQDPTIPRESSPVSSTPVTARSPTVQRSQTTTSFNSQRHSQSSSIYSTQSNQFKLAASSPTYQNQQDIRKNTGTSNTPLARNISSSSSSTAPSPNQQRFSISSTSTNAAANIVPNVSQQQNFVSSPSQHVSTYSATAYSPNQRHSRLNSTSSRFSRSSTSSESMPSHSKNSGSFYVRELKRRAATLWCDIPPSVWGLPIGLVDTSHLTLHASPNGTYTAGPPLPNSSNSNSSNGNGTTSSSGSGNAVGGHFFPGSSNNTSNGSKSKSFNPAVDIRHSHLTPRLLASEVGDDADDYAIISNGRIVNTSASNPSSASNPNGSSLPSSRSTTLRENEASDFGLESTSSGAGDGSHHNFGSMSSSASVEINRYASVASGKSGQSRRSNLSTVSTNNNNSGGNGSEYDDTDRQSLNSINEEDPKVEFFVMNPDASDSDSESD